MRPGHILAETLHRAGNRSVAVCGRTISAIGSPETTASQLIRGCVDIRSYRKA